METGNEVVHWATDGSVVTSSQQEPNCGCLRGFVVSLTRIRSDFVELTTMSDGNELFLFSFTGYETTYSWFFSSKANHNYFQE